MLTPGSKAPEFNVPACVSVEKGKEFKNVSLKDNAGKWVVLYTYPKDFTFVCPTEIVEFDKKLKDFADRGAVVLGGSTDNEHSHLAWRKNHADLTGLKHPLLFVNATMAQAYGLLHPTAEVALRATFIIDPNGVIRYATANDLSDQQQEKEADWLGGCLLIPGASAQMAARRGDDDSAVALRFGVSVQMATMRMNSSGARKIAQRAAVARARFRPVGI